MLEKIISHQSNLQACTRCPNMIQPVITGLPVASQIMLIGQAPGIREGNIGRPFGWTAGKTLFKWFSSIGVDEEKFREQVYIAAVCRCFPGKNPKGSGDRVPDKQAGALLDVQRAIRIVRYRAREWHLNPGKVGVIGFSAGGSLAARLSTNDHLNTYKNIDKADEESYKPDFVLLIYSAYLDNGPGRSLSPELIVNENTPPMFLFGTADDPYSNSLIVMADALHDIKVPFELHILSEGGHGYGLRPGIKAAEAWPKLAKGWLELDGN